MSVRRTWLTLYAKNNISEEVIDLYFDGFLKVVGLFYNISDGLKRDLKHKFNSDPI